MRVLVVGASGFIGSHLAGKLASLGHEIEGWGRRPEHPSNLAHYQRVDLADSGALADRQGSWDTVYLLSGHSVPGSAWTVDMVLENLRITARFLEFIRSASPQARVVVASSALVYPPSEELANENSQISPRSLYGLSKAMIEDWASFEARSLDIQIVRIFNQVGGGMPKGLLAMDALERILGSDETLWFLGSDSIRDYLDVRDGAEGLARLMTVQAAPGSVWNLCSGEGCSVSTLAGTLMELLNIKKDIRFKKSQADRLVGDPGKFREATGWRPRHGLRSALARLAGLEA